MASLINKVTWRAPSNIAIVKYWGKKGIQIPMNPSVSFTLDCCYTETSLRWRQGTGNIEFLFEGSKNPSFEKKIVKFIKGIKNELPFLDRFDLKIESTNSFPHSTAIASSASSMAALALCLLSMKEKVAGKVEDFFLEASYIARLGSGSACRSLYKNVVCWGESYKQDTSDLFGVELKSIHPVFKTFCDSIIVVDSSEKAVSSRAGHALMNTHRYSSIRYEIANRNFRACVEALESGDINAVGHILEDEALNLHALMMTSTPSYILLRPESLAIIDSVKAFRNDTGIPVYFTLDAGPNIHLLYPEKFEREVRTFIEKELILLTETRKVIHDKVGQGPKEITA